MDGAKKLLFHAPDTVSQKAINLLLSLATIFGFRIWSEDMILAYIQGTEKILHMLKLKGKPEFQLRDSHLFEIHHPLFGLECSVDYWKGIFLKHLNRT